MEFIKQNIKNVLGFRTKRKIIVFSVDDYGNVRLASKEARRKMDMAGVKVRKRYDAYDALENKEDLESLLETLSSVKDKNNKNAVFTPYALPANINFEKIKTEGYAKYYYELLPDTFSKLNGPYNGTWDLWKEGMRNGLLAPQFHGREHLNLKVFEEKLRKNDFEVITALKNRSYTSITSSGYSSISYTAAFDFWERHENEKLKDIAKDGLICFEKVFGYKASCFTPPGGRESSEIHKTLKEGGIEFIDTPFIKNEHVGNGNYKKVLNYTGKKNSHNQYFIVRNVVFEPLHDRGVDWVKYALQQIESAFRWNKPANISSHRINFSGHINPKNREIGIRSLKALLTEIIKKWPEVEFISADELGNIIRSKK
ncbi:MAG: hypothetical protein ACNS60_10410 [Candidatus Cyclobacteriaceae bacterium M2_1C_046]